ncbi:MAG: esterase family protein [Bacteroidales bacterium]|nr:esterase family protein [Bacteroidales bacterium]
MKRYFLAIILLLPLLVLSQSQVLISQQIDSKILHQPKLYSVYLPDGFASSTKQYPVLYLLHGLGGDETDWIRKGQVQRTVDSLIQADLIKPLVIIMPDAEDTYYMNHNDGMYQFEDFFFMELMPTVEKSYGCLGDREHRYIAGLSMGGFGSLLYALHHPELFSICGPMSAAIRTDQEIREMTWDVYGKRYGAMTGVKEGEERITSFWNKHSILYLVDQLPANPDNSVKYYMDCGDDDYLFRGNAELYIRFMDKKIPHEFRVRNGMHTWDYWRDSLPEVLKFIFNPITE